MVVQNQCRDQTYKAQLEIIRGFNDLIRLNPQAAQLRRQKKVALRAVANAKETYSLAAAMAYLAYVETQQKVFQTRQKLIIETSQSKAKTEIYRINGQTYSSSIPFALNPRPISSVTPSYYPDLNLKNKQDIIVKWTIKNSLKQTQEGQCGSHIKKTPLGFQAKYSYPDTLF